MATRQVEILTASEYYRRRTPGVIVLVNGDPTHFTGRGCKQEASAFAKKMSEPYYPAGYMQQRGAA